MNQNNRTEDRRSLQKECVLANQFDLIKAETVDISKAGLGVKTDRTFQFENGCELAVSIPSIGFPKAKLMWTKKDFNNTTRLGLKFLPA